MNGEEAIDKIMKKNISRCCTSYKIVFMDLNMPVMSGIEATRVLREKIKQREIQGTIIIALSAKALDLDEDAFFCKSNGFDSYLPKPIAKKELKGILTQYNVI